MLSFLDFKKYSAQHCDDYWLSSSIDIGTGMRIQLDNTHGYLKEGHPLWVWVENGYLKESYIVPMTVGYLPELVFDVPLDITIPDFVRLRMFISENQKLIKDIADEKFDYSKMDFRVRCLLKESILRLDEMPNYKPFQTGVPHDIWIDKGKTYLKGGHGPRVKVFSRKNPNLAVSFSTVDLEPKDRIPKGEERTMKIAQSWIGYNLPNIEKLMNGEMEEDEFLQRMIIFKNGKPFKKEELNKIIPYKIFKEQGITVVARKSDGAINAIRTMDNAEKPLFKIWFDEYIDSVGMAGGFVLFLRKGNEEYACNCTTKTVAKISS